MRGCQASLPGGLPHSETRGSRDIGSSPRLFAADRVLPRLAAPRHPPWTLISLDHIVLSIPSLYCKKTQFIHSLPRQAERNRTPSESREMGLTRLELVTSCLSGKRSNHLSYRPGQTYQRREGIWKCKGNCSADLHCRGRRPPSVPPEVRDVNLSY